MPFAKKNVIDAIMTIRDLYAEIGLSLAAATASKNVICGLGQNYTPAQYQLAQASDLHWIPCNLGLQIGGTPVGSFDYMVESVNKTVDAIVSDCRCVISMGRMECYVPEYRLYLQ